MKKLIGFAMCAALVFGVTFHCTSAYSAEATEQPTVVACNEKIANSVEYYEAMQILEEIKEDELKSGDIWMARLDTHHCKVWSELAKILKGSSYLLTMLNGYVAIERVEPGNVQAK